MDLLKYRKIFLVEARGHLSRFKGAVDALERDPSSVDGLAACSLAAHSIKGMALSMKFAGIGALAAKLEHMSDGRREGKAPVEPAVVLVFRHSADVLGRMVDAVDRGAPFEEDLTALSERLDVLASPPSRP